MAVGVVGVIMMTRQLVEEDEHFPFNSSPPEKTLSTLRKEDVLPTISEEDDENETLLEELKSDFKMSEMNQMRKLQTISESSE